MLSVKVFIIHTKFLEHRKTGLQKLVETFEQSSDMKIDVEYVSAYEPESIKSEDIKGFLDLGKNEELLGKTYNDLVKNLHVKEASNVLKHLWAIQQGVEVVKNDATVDYVMVLEDDVLYGDNINTILFNSFKAIGKELEKDDAPHIYFLGQPAKEAIENKGITFRNTQEDFKIIPCCDSYVIPAQFVEKVATAFLPIRFITNVQLSYILEHKDIKAVSIWPNVFVDGSKFGTYISSIETNNRLFLNNDYNMMLKNIMDPKVVVTDAQFDNLKFKDHPDMQYLRGLAAFKRNEFAKTKEIFDAIYPVYEANHNMLNNKSEFLFNYINVHKFLQPPVV